MERIDDLAVRLVNAKLAKDTRDYEACKKEILLDMKHNALQLRWVERRYIVSKALVYILLETSSSNKEVYENLVLQTYYSLLKCILDIREKGNEETNCSELAATSKIAFAVLSENFKQVAWIHYELIGYEAESAVNQTLKLLYYHYWSYRLLEIDTLVDNELEALFYKAKLRYRTLGTSDKPTPEVEEKLQQGVGEICRYIELTFSHDEDYYMDLYL